MSVLRACTVGYTIIRSPEISLRLITVLFVTDFEARAALYVNSSKITFNFVKKVVALNSVTCITTQ